MLQFTYNRCVALNLTLNWRWRYVAVNRRRHVCLPSSKFEFPCAVPPTVSTAKRAQTLVHYRHHVFIFDRVSIWHSGTGAESRKLF